MSSLIPCSTTDLSLIPRIPFTDNNTDFFRRPCLARKSGKYRFSSQRVFLPLPVSVLSFPQLQRQCSFLRNPIVHKVAATGTDVAVEEPDSPAVDEDSSGTPETQDADDTTTPAPSQTRRSRPSWKSEMPPVKNEELVPGASFTGKVRSIQPFGAFVDFGAFTDGLVHVSRLSDSFVKDVGSFVTVGQEVKVKLLEVNFENSRISLSMRENEDSGKSQQRRDSSTTATTDRPRPSRRSTPRTGQKKEDVKSSKFVKGQELTGAVKNLTRSGAFISLPDGEEGFLPSSEEDDDGFASMMGGGSSLEVGQEVNVRVLRISRAQVTLTMKKEDSNTEVETVHGVIHSATNPFVLAFRQNKDIARFLDEREKVEKTTQQPAEPLTSAESESEVTTDIPDVQEKPTSSDEGVITTSSAADESSEDDENSSKGTIGGNLVDDSKDEASETMAQIIEEAPSEGDEISDSSGELAGQLSSSESTTDTNAAQSPPVDPIAKYAEAAPVAEIEEDKSSQQVADGVTTVADEGSDTPVQEAKDEVKSVENLVPSDEASSDQTNSATEELVENQVKSNEDAQLPDPTSEIQDESKKDEEQIPSPTAETEIDDDEGDQQIPSPTSETENESVNVDPQIPSLTAETKTEGESDLDKASSEQMVDVGNLNGQNGNSTPKETAAKATVSPALVKQLREETGAGMMDCKKALAETGGDIVKAQEFLRKKGLASAEKKASRVTAEGRIGSYIHDGRIGVLVEVNCETDFVSRGEIFKELVDDLAMQVAACPQVQYLVTEDVPEEIVNKEKEIEMQKEDLASKPEQIRSKIVEGRIRKRLEELALLEQPYIRSDKVVVKDLVKQTIATIGENIKVRRFVRFNLGEGLEKKSQDFAAEVAAQTAAKKPVTAPAVEQSPTPEAKEESQKPPAVAVSAALVKQLREETGAGMMDCKKALSETGGDLEKAQEYLRKKGLSTADKKSSRLAAEGRIGTYIHDSRIGVLIEVNCETDFVGRSEKFKELVDDLAMQVVACPQVQFVSIEEIPDSVVKKEKEIEMQREDILSKPDNIRERIVEGRISKRLGELAVLEQPFIRDDSLLVKDLVKQTVAALGENVKVRRFVRFTLGESDEEAKKEDEA